MIGLNYKHFSVDVRNFIVAFGMWRQSFWSEGKPEGELTW